MRFPFNTENCFMQHHITSLAAKTVRVSQFNFFFLFYDGDGKYFRLEFG